MENIMEKLAFEAINCQGVRPFIHLRQILQCFWSETPGE